MTDLWQRLKNERRPIYLYGMGNGADKILDECIRQGIEISGVFASDGFVRHQLFRGFTVESYSSVKEKSPDMIALLCFGSALPDVISSVKKKAREITLFAPSVPVYGENIFNAVFYEENKEKIRLAHSVFADDKSKDVFEKIIEYRLSGDINYLFEIETNREENYKLLNLNNERFLDLGAYRGDTLSEVNSVCSLEEAIAVEPDAKSFKKLKDNTSYIKNVSYFNCAAGANDGQALFEKSRGRGSAVGDYGEFIPVRSVDSLIENKAVSFIKIDVEGSEKEAILGAEKTIKKYKPKMKIAAYHRSEDIFDLPLLIKGIYDGYSLFLRHEPSLPDWDTDILAIPEE